MQTLRSDVKQAVNSGYMHDIKAKNRSSKARRDTPGKQTASQRTNIDVFHRVLAEQVCTGFCITWPMLMTHSSLWCRWYSALWPVPAMPCPLPGPATCGKILTFISATGPAARDTRSPSDPYAQVPAFTICPHLTPAHTHTHTHTKCMWTHTHTGMSDTS